MFDYGWYLGIEIFFDDMIDNSLEKFDKNMERMGDDIVKTVERFKDGSIVTHIVDNAKEDIQTIIERFEEDLDL